MKFLCVEGESKQKQEDMYSETYSMYLIELWNEEEYTQKMNSDGCTQKNGWFNYRVKKYVSYIPNSQCIVKSLPYIIWNWCNDIFCFIDVVSIIWMESTSLLCTEPSHCATQSTSPDVIVHHVNYVA